jgi:hypothetical protein
VDDGGARHGRGWGTIVKPFQTRRHRNSRTAEVKLQRDGQFYAYSRPPDTPALEVSYGHEARSLFGAHQLADYLAHPDCDGVGCGTWQNDHGDDPECLAALEREAIASAASLR